MKRKLLFLVLVLSLVSPVIADGVEIHKGVEIHQPNENTHIESGSSFSIKNLTVLAGKTIFESSPFTINHTDTGTLNVTLNMYNRSANVGSFTANFSSQTNNEDVTFQFGNLEQNSLYEWFKNGTSQNRKESTSSGGYQFTINSWSGELYEFGVKNIDNLIPSLGTATYVDNRTSNTLKMVTNIDDKDEQDISSYSGYSSVLTFTNETISTGISSFPFDKNLTVTDNQGASTGKHEYEIDRSDTGLQERDEYNHNLSNQRIEQITDLTNNGQDINFKLDHADNGKLIQGGKWNGTLSSGTTSSFTSVWSGDWITEVKTNYSQNEEKISKSGKAVYIQRNWVNITNDKSNIPFHSVSTNLGKSGWTCNSVGKINLTAGETQNMHEPVNCSANKVNEQIVSRDEIDPDVGVVGNMTTYNLTADVINNAGYKLDVQVGLDDMMFESSDKPVDDLVFNETFNKGESTRYKKQFKAEVIHEIEDLDNCPSGYSNFGNFCRKTVDKEDGTMYYYKQYVDVENDDLKNVPIRYDIPKSRFVDWSFASQIQWSVNGTDDNTNLDTTKDDVVPITVQTDYGQSSLHEGTWEFTVQYFRSDPSGGGSGGGGGGTGSTDEEENKTQDTNPVKAFEITNPGPTIVHSVDEGTKIINQFRITNKFGRELRFSAYPKTDSRACEFINFRAGQQSLNYLENVTIEAGSGNYQGNRFITYEIQMPYNITERNYVCKYIIEAQNGYTQTVEFHMNMKGPAPQGMIQGVTEWFGSKLFGGNKLACMERKPVNGTVKGNNSFSLNGKNYKCQSYYKVPEVNNGHAAGFVALMSVITFVVMRL